MGSFLLNEVFSLCHMSTTALFEDETRLYLSVRIFHPRVEERRLSFDERFRLSR